MSDGDGDLILRKSTLVPLSLVVAFLIMLVPAVGFQVRMSMTVDANSQVLQDIKDNMTTNFDTVAFDKWRDEFQRRNPTIDVPPIVR